ncbi:MAG TPA: acylneuraminate cytidylyltransferase [Verrucomicrobia bacterium]|nr:MAG: acylneuraminate cytidylyltransferase [Lentisphaerae bacterium GWF2_57_35]HBA86058.1 acylneuraminate cytidylyltransferase [Verrucomicrobiota bacterium]
MVNNNQKCVAIIPARGGSKGIPRKNIRALAGRPLLAWSIEDAQKASGVDGVYVSTDDQEIAETALKHGAEVIRRPSELATDTSSSESALLHALDRIEAGGVVVESVVFLQATSPLREPKHIEEALQIFKQAHADSLVSVCPSHAFLWKEEDGCGIPMNYDPSRRPMRQAMRQYRETGSIYIFRPQLLRATGSRLGGRIALYKMPEECGLDIDSLEDWAIAERVLSEGSRI